MQNGFTMSDISASDFPQVYEQLGINTGDLGCIMLDLNDIPVTNFVPDAEESLYFSNKQEFVKGAVAEDHPHITLLYGLLQYGSILKPQVDAVLEDWDSPTHLNIASIGVFPSRDPEEDYSCIVAHIEFTDDLQEGHDRLRLLPHVDTFPQYKPHMTLAYVNGPATTEWVEALQPLTGQGVRVLGLNYGK